MFFFIPLLQCYSYTRVLHFRMHFPAMRSYPVRLACDRISWQMFWCTFWFSGSSRCLFLSCSLPPWFYGARPRAFFSRSPAFIKLLYRYTLLCGKIHTLFYVTRAPFQVYFFLHLCLSPLLYSTLHGICEIGVFIVWKFCEIVDKSLYSEPERTVRLIFYKSTCHKRVVFL